MEITVQSIKIIIKQEDELDASELALLQTAQAATYRSYAPYSNFKVGAAVSLENGEVISGNNQENCSYPQGLCAERTAIFYANSRYPDTPVTALCIAARDSSGEFTRMPVSPCGGCRQVMLESEHRYGRNIKIMLYGTDGIYILSSARDLLPVGFDQEQVGRSE